MLRANAEPVAYSQMLLCALATTAPLMLALFRQELGLAIYGALTGYFLSINDHQGSLRHRLWVVVVTFSILLLGFASGLRLQEETFLLFLVLAALTYWIGLMGGEGGEYERAILFATVQVIVASHTPGLTLEHLLPIFKYSLFSFLFVVVATGLHSAIMRPEPRPLVGWREALQKATDSDRQLHALSYMLVALLAVGYVASVPMERGYWIVITTLLVMKPDHRLSLYRSFQRLFGTFLGVLVTELIIFTFHTPLPILLSVMVVSGLVPWALKRNYWLLSGFASILVILLLDLPDVEAGNLQMPLLRLRMTALGCLFGAFGVLTSKLLMASFRAESQQLAGK